MTEHVWRTPLGRQVRDALVHLHDLPYLQSHPLADTALGSRAARALQVLLVEAIAAQKPNDRGSAASGRLHRLLSLRYLDALAIQAVCRELGIGKTEFHATHQRGLAAVIASFRDSIRERTRGRVPAPYPTKLVGRSREMALAQRQLSEGRLLTITGAPGAGKTRLARELIRSAQADFSDGVWFIPLAPISEPGLVLPTIGRALGLHEDPSRAWDEVIVECVARWRALLILDNFEQVESAGSMVADVFGRCPHVSVIVTSRVPLRVYGERELPIAPLGLPPFGSDPTMSEAVQLFADRARAVQSDFELTAENAPIIADICRYLDGLPLALELVAARVRMFEPGALLERLRRSAGRLSLAVGGAHDLPARHQTLRAAVSWSHDLLNADERLLFRRLGIFAGGFTLAAVEAVCGFGVTSAELLESLVTKSLVQRAPAGDRFGMLETVRDIAVESLEASGEHGDVALSHAEHFRDFIEVVRDGEGPVPNLAALERLEAERENIRGAIGWALCSNSAEVGLQLAARASVLWTVRGDRLEAKGFLAAMLALPSAAVSEARVHALLMSASSGYTTAADAERLTDEALTAAGLLADERLLALAHERRGAVAMGLGDEAGAKSHLESALEMARRLGDELNVAHLLLRLGRLSDDVARLAEGERIFRAHGNLWGIGHASGWLGGIAWMRGDATEAELRFTAARRTLLALGDSVGAADVQARWGNLALNTGDLELAEASCLGAIGTFVEMRAPESLARCVYTLAGVAAAKAQPARALTLRGFADALWERIAGEVTRVPREIRQIRVSLDRYETQLSSLAAAEACAAGRAMSQEEAVALALA